MRNKTFEYFRLRDPLVATCLDQGLGSEQTIVALCQRHEELMKRVVLLESIAPRKIRIAPDKFAVWHCPDDLVPETNLGTL